MNSNLKRFLILSALLVLLSFPHFAQAQEQGPIYIVQEGDTLYAIALSFGVTVEDLAVANNLADVNALQVGDRLVIPGLEGVSGILETTRVRAGENVHSISRVNRIPTDLLLRLNHLVSPAELHAGASLVMTRGQSLSNPYRVTLRPGESLLEASLRTGVNPWEAAGINNLSTATYALPGDVLFVDKPGDGGQLGLPITVESMSVSNIYQGETALVRLVAKPGLEITGQLGPYDLHFFEDPAGTFASLQGVHTLLDAGMYLLEIHVGNSSGADYGYAQYVRVRPREHVFETIQVDPALIDPELSEAELAQLLPFLTTLSNNRSWNGPFLYPSPFQDCINSTFGNRRSYNGSAFTFYHSGVDFCGGTGVDILAPAAGTVLLTDAMEVRGNITLIDHGWGVVSAYLHQSEILVNPGDSVTPGQVIGRVGNTGRSTGPHLHWEIWVGGVPIDPLTWISNTYP